MAPRDRPRANRHDLSGSNTHCTRDLWAIAGFWLVCAFLTGYARRPARPLALAPAREFSQARAARSLALLAGDGQARTPGSDADGGGLERLSNYLRSIGLRPQLQESFGCSPGACGHVRNLIVRIEGREPGFLLLVAHHDSVGAGAGASDDAVGVAAVIEVARALRVGPSLRHGVLLLFTDAEEVGSLGAAVFAEQHPFMREVAAVINVDNGGTSGNTLLYQTGPGNLGVIERYAAAVARPTSNSFFSVVQRFLPRDSDFSVFVRAGLPGLNLAFAGGEARYHTALDTVGLADPRSLQLQGDTLLALTRALAGGDLSQLVQREAVWFDLFGRWLVAWPASWSSWGVIAALLMLASAAWRGHLQLMASSLGALAPLLASVFAALLAYAIQRLLARVGLVPATFVAMVWPLFAAMIAVGFACNLLLARVLARCDPRSLAFGGFCSWLLAAGVCAFTLPGASILFLPVALTVALLSALFRATSYGFVVAGIAASLWVGTIWFPSVALATDSFGITSLPVFAGPAAWLGSLLLPGLAALPARRRSLLLMAAGLVALLSLGLHAFTPRFDRTAPERVNVLYYADAGAGFAALDPAWIGPAGPIPGQMRTALERLTRGRPEHAAPFAWRLAPLLFAPLRAASPQRTPPIVSEAGADAHSTSLRVELVSGVRQLSIVVDDAAPIVELRIGARHWPSSTQPGRAGLHYRRWLLIAPRPLETLQIVWQRGRAGATDLTFVAESAGVPSELAPLVQARPAWVAASQTGDHSLVWTRLKL